MTKAERRALVVEKQEELLAMIDQAVKAAGNAESRGDHVVAARLLATAVFLRDCLPLRP